MEIVKIDLVPSGVMPSCHASQYDIGREIRFLLTDGGEEYTLAGTETISIKLRKPDGTSETIAIPNTSSNYVDWETSDGELDLSGVYLAEISIKNGDDVLGSANFIVKTEADAYDGADIRTITVGPADICTFETTLPEPLQSVKCEINATGGNGTPDNPNPINGFTEANIARCGVNLWDEEWELGIYGWTGVKIPDNTRIRCKNFIPCSAETTYYIVAPYGLQIFYYDNAQTCISYEPNSVRNATITTPVNCAYMTFFLYSADYGTTYKNDISINYPSTDHNYHPYTGDTYTIAFGRTVYGGVLDVTRGKLTVTHAKSTIIGANVTEVSGYNNVHFFAYKIPDDGLSSLTKTGRFSIFPDAQYLYPFDSADNIGKVANNAQNGRFWFGFSTDTTLAQAQSVLNGTDMLYELATPFDIDLTPEVISAIVGTNNVFADCGQTTVKYLKAGA